MKTMREFLKDDLRLQLDFSQSDQNRMVPAPPVQKPLRQGQTAIPLSTGPAIEFAGKIDMVDALRERKSHRSWKEEPLNIAELGFLLWAVQGVRKDMGQGRVFRTVPSAGCRHSFETYIFVNDCRGLEAGLYRYLPLEHALVLEKPVWEGYFNAQNEAVLFQSFVPKAPVVFVWTTVPYRMEWRYMEAAHRVIALDAGHVCQNLYLAVQAMGCGTCAVAAFNQKVLDDVLGVDGEDEFALYLAPVGKV